MKRHLRRLVPLFIGLMLVGCGIDWGNPVDKNNSQASGGSLGPNRGLELLDAICSTLIRCYPSVEELKCRQGVLNTSTMDTELGLRPADFADFQTVVVTEDSGRISADAPHAQQCQTDMKALACSDPKVVNAYNVNNPNHYDNVYQLLSSAPNSCPGFYVYSH